MGRNVVTIPDVDLSNRKQTERVIPTTKKEIRNELRMLLLERREEIYQVFIFSLFSLFLVDVFQSGEYTVSSAENLLSDAAVISMTKSLPTTEREFADTEVPPFFLISAMQSHPRVLVRLAPHVIGSDSKRLCSTSWLSTRICVLNAHPRLIIRNSISQATIRPHPERSLCGIWLAPWWNLVTNNRNLVSRDFVPHVNTVDGVIDCWSFCTIPFSRDCLCFVNRSWMNLPTRLGPEHLDTLVAFLGSIRAEDDTTRRNAEQMRGRLERISGYVPSMLVPLDIPLLLLCNLLVFIYRRSLQGKTLPFPCDRSLWPLFLRLFRIFGWLNSTRAFFYFPHHRNVPISDEEKAGIRQMILSLLEEPEWILAIQISMIIGKLSRWDYPRDWCQLSLGFSCLH